MTGKVAAPSDLTSMRRMKEVAGLVSNTPLIEIEEVLLIAVFCSEPEMVEVGKITGGF